MNAIQPVQTPLSSVEFRDSGAKKTRSIKPAAQDRLQRTHRQIAIETSLKLSVNLALAGIAISALTHLIPYYLLGREKLSQLETEVEQTQSRVQQLRTQFSYYFDPQQVKTIMQQESNLVDPTQKRIVFVESQDK